MIDPFVVISFLPIKSHPYTVRPLWVKMQGDNKPLSAGGNYGLVCEVVGSRPKPVITWWKGSILMKNSTDLVSFELSVHSPFTNFRSILFLKYTHMHTNRPVPMETSPHRRSPLRQQSTTVESICPAVPNSR